MPITVSPNVKKYMLANFLVVLMYVFVAIVILIILNFTAGLDIFLDIFSTFGLEINPAVLWGVLLLIVVVYTVVHMIIAYFSVHNYSFEFYDNRLTYTKPVMGIFSSSKDLLYDHISRISYHSNGMFDSMFSTGSVILDLSAMGEKELVMDNIENPESVTNQINEIIRSYNVRKTTTQIEQRKINDLLNQGGL